MTQHDDMSQSDRQWEAYEEEGWPQEPQEPAQERPKTIFRITCGRWNTHPCEVYFWTNDDTDSGYPGSSEDDIATDTFTMPNLAAALKHTGYTRAGVLSDVEVYVDGELVYADRPVARIETDNGTFRCQAEHFGMTVGESYTDECTVIIYEKMPSDLNYGDIDLPNDPLILRRLATMLRRRATFLEEHHATGGQTSSGDQS